MIAAFATVQTDISVSDVSAYMVAGMPRVIVEGKLSMQFDPDSAREFAANLIHAAAQADVLEAEADRLAAVQS